MPFDGRVVSSTQALSPARVPRRLVVVGAGYIGLELGTVYRKLGAEVHVVEAADRILPAYDADLVRPVRVALEKQGVALHLQSTVLGLNPRSEEHTSELQSLKRNSYAVFCLHNTKDK